MKALLQSSLDLVAHRGPDGRGAIIGQGRHIHDGYDAGSSDWALGHVRLSILDTTSAGHQPMCTSDKQCWITYNGEIYNYVEIRKELQQLGYHFRTGTDTEVILASYQEWGSDCVQHFVGMFAFVLIDLIKNRVFVARDRLGIKPLYIYQSSHATVIVSELKQLKAFPWFKAKANKQLVIDFLIDEVLGHEPAVCFFEGVHALIPGHSLCWDLGSNARLDSSKSYWEPAQTQKNISWNDAVEETGRIFRMAVEQRLRSDVPVGSCLSGGMDSSSIVCTVASELQTPIKTFSACFNGFEFDEQVYIDSVTKHCGNHAVKVFPAAETLQEDIEKLIYHQDEPFVTLSLYAQWCVMKAARAASVPVLLDGQGGDEALCGYRKYSFFFLKSLLLNRKYIDFINHAKNMFLKGDKRLFEFSAGQRYLPGFLRKRSGQIYDFLKPDWQKFYRPVWRDKMRNVSSMKDHQLADLRLWSLPALLRYEDRNSMAHSIEARIPFVDHRLIEHCLSLPDRHFFKNGQTKRLLVETLGDKLPDVVRNRRTKLGFETPQSKWLKGSLGDYLASRITKSTRLSEILNTDKAKNALKDYQRGSDQYSDSALFRIACLAMWLDCFSVEV